MINKKLRLAVVSTHLSKNSGLSQYTADLINSKSFRNFFRDIEVFSVNINPHDKKESFEIDLTDIQDLINTSTKINEKYDVVNIQFDEYYFHNNDLVELNYLNFYTFLSSLTVPTIVTLHFCFRNKKFFNNVLRSISHLPNVHLVVHAKSQVNHIRSISKSNNNIHLVYHGYPDEIAKVSIQEKILYNKFKKKNKDSAVLMTLGYFGEWKNQLNTIKLVADLIEEGLNIKYYVVGSDEYGQKYFLQCRNEVTSRKLNKNIILKNEYLSRKKFNLYMKCADIYIAYHKSYDNLNPSGTITYALGAGAKVITSKTMFSNSSEIKKLITVVEDDFTFSKAVTRLVSGKNLKSKLLRKPVSISRDWAWSKISKKYLDVIVSSFIVSQKSSVINKLPLIYISSNGFKNINMSNGGGNKIIYFRLWNLPFTRLIKGRAKKIYRLFQYIQLYLFLEVQTIYNRLRYIKLV